MKFVMQGGARMALVICCLGLAAQAFADGSEDAASQSRSISTRVDWEQRVLQRPAEPIPSDLDSAVPAVASLPESGFSDGGVRLVADEIRLDSLPADGTYEDGAYEVENITDSDILNLGSDMVPMDGCSDCGDCGQCDSCGPIGDCGWEAYRFCSSAWARDLSLFLGVQGFKGPPDRGRVGNFGLHEGINFGAPLGGWRGLGYQIGFAATQSNFSGDQAVLVRRSGRNQLFGTVGIFRRSQCNGWDWGIAFDMAHDNYYDKTDLKQIRTETAFCRHGNWQVGYWGAYGVNDADFQLNPNALRLKPTDQFAFFYRRFFENGGDGRIWAGFSGDGDGILGAEAHAPLGRGWSLENRISYLIPKQGRGAVGMAEESWSVAVRIVWHLGQPARCALDSPYRPIFSVADNTMFKTDIE